MGTAVSTPITVAMVGVGAATAMAVYSTGAAAELHAGPAPVDLLFSVFLFRLAAISVPAWSLTIFGKLGNRTFSA